MKSDFRRCKKILFFETAQTQETISPEVVNQQKFRSL